MKNIGIYIHIPFCKSKCYYCDFISFADCQKYIDEYVTLMKEEIRSEKAYNIETIYIGGGTPSYIDSKYIKDILMEFKYRDAEITIEVNAGTVDEQKLKEYYEMGINRISMGLQTADNELLKQIGRIHNYEEFANTYNLARKIGFRNINIDIMIGLPNQTMGILEDTLYEVLKLKPEHISVYSLILEEGTKLYNLVKSGDIKLPPEEVERQMYWYVKEKLEEAGYVHYEISNFAKPGFCSKHNMDCWSQKEYRGFGLGAHSYIDNIRYCNTSVLEDYMKTPIIVNEVQTQFTKMQEYVMLGLRKIEGISIESFYEKFGKSVEDIFENELNKLLSLGLIEKKDNYIRLSKKGINFANIVWAEFV